MWIRVGILWIRVGILWIRVFGILWIRVRARVRVGILWIRVGILWILWTLSFFFTFLVHHWVVPSKPYFLLTQPPPDEKVDMKYGYEKPEYEVWCKTDRSEGLESVFVNVAIMSVIEGSTLTLGVRA